MLELNYLVYVKLVLPLSHTKYWRLEGNQLTLILDLDYRQFSFRNVKSPTPEGSTPCNGDTERLLLKGVPFFN